MSKSRTAVTRIRDRGYSSTDKRVKSSAPYNPAVRETVESIVMAVALAFLFRAFVAEAFVIPTGSMAPTLMGQHKDVECPKCHFRYQVGASIENDERTRTGQGGSNRIEGIVVGTTCPMCRYRMTLDLFHDANQRTFVGDRILVSKFLYDFSKPRRWDVIVFKYPLDAKQNYIKRLVGLPGETILLRHGDVFIQNGDQDGFHIARKRDSKLKAMLQLVDDSKYIAEELTDLGWPLRWQAWSKTTANGVEQWVTNDEGHGFRTKGEKDHDVWLRYHHIVPSAEDWERIERGDIPGDLKQRKGRLITDFYAYNAYTSVEPLALDARNHDPRLPIPEMYPDAKFGRSRVDPYGPLGLHWVGDLALEGEVDIQGNQGELLLQLVKGGVHYICRIDVATGEATLTMAGGPGQFESADGTTAEHPECVTSIRRAGRHRIRFSNIDAEIRLWVDNRRVEFDGPTTYQPLLNPRPAWSPEEPGDLAPLGIGSRGLAMSVERLRVLRDVYYIAPSGNRMSDYMTEYTMSYTDPEIHDILQDPKQWKSTPLFTETATFDHTLKANEFFPMGDNSPQSSDARLWSQHYFSRKLLIGKALLIYWPHPWNRPIPFLPNVKRMRLIR